MSLAESRIPYRIGGGNVRGGLDRSGNKAGNAKYDNRSGFRPESETLKTVDSERNKEEQGSTIVEASRCPTEEKKIAFDVTSFTETTAAPHGHDGARPVMLGDRPNGRPSRKTSYPIDRRHWQKHSHMALQEAGTGSRPRRTHGHNFRALRAKDLEERSFAMANNAGLTVPAASSLAEATGLPCGPDKGNKDGDGIGGYNVGGRSRAGRVREIPRRPEAVVDDHLLSWVNSVLSYPGSETADSSCRLNSLSDLGDHRVLSLTVRRVATQNDAPISLTPREGEEDDDDIEGSTGSSKCDIPRQKESYKGEFSARERDGGPARTNGGGASWVARSDEESNGPHDSGSSGFGDTALGRITAIRGRRPSRSVAPEELEEGTGLGGTWGANRGPRRGSSSKLRSMLGLKKKDQHSSARGVKKDLAVLLSGQPLKDRDPPRLPGDLDSAVDRACAGDVDAVRSLLSMLKDCQTILPAARAERGVRRGGKRSASYEPRPRTSLVSGGTPSRAQAVTSAEVTMSMIKPSESKEDDPDPRSVTTARGREAPVFSTEPSAPSFHTHGPRGPTTTIPIAFGEPSVSTQARATTNPGTAGTHELAFSSMAPSKSSPQTMLKATAGDIRRGFTKISATRLLGAVRNDALAAAGVLIPGVSTPMARGISGSGFGSMSTSTWDQTASTSDAELQEPGGVAGSQESDSGVKVTISDGRERDRDKSIWATNSSSSSTPTLMQPRSVSTRPKRSPQRVAERSPRSSSERQRHHMHHGSDSRQQHHRDRHWQQKQQQPSQGSTIPSTSIKQKSGRSSSLPPLTKVAVSAITKYQWPPSSNGTFHQSRQQQQQKPKDDEKKEDKLQRDQKPQQWSPPGAGPIKVRHLGQVAPSSAVPQDDTWTRALTWRSRSMAPKVAGISSASGSDSPVHQPSKSRQTKIPRDTSSSEAAVNRAVGASLESSEAGSNFRRVRSSPASSADARSVRVDSKPASSTDGQGGSARPSRRGASSIGTKLREDGSVRSRRGRRHSADGKSVPSSASDGHLLTQNMGTGHALPKTRRSPPDGPRTPTAGSGSRPTFASSAPRTRSRERYSERSVERSTERYRESRSSRTRVEREERSARKNADRERVPPASTSSAAVKSSAPSSSKPFDRQRTGDGSGSAERRRDSSTGRACADAPRTRRPRGSESGLLAVSAGGGCRSQSVPPTGSVGHNVVEAEGSAVINPSPVIVLPVWKQKELTFTGGRKEEPAAIPATTRSPTLIEMKSSQDNTAAIVQRQISPEGSNRNVPLGCDNFQGEGVDMEMKTSLGLDEATSSKDRRKLSPIEWDQKSDEGEQRAVTVSVQPDVSRTDDGGAQREEKKDDKRVTDEEASLVVPREPPSSPIPEGAGTELAATEVSATEAFSAGCMKGVRLVVEFVGSVEGVARARAVSSGWRRAVREQEDYLFKVIVRRAGVTPRRRAAFWEHMILRRPPHGGQADQLEDPLLGGQDDDDAAKRLSLSELSRKGMASQWSKAIDADVARTFGRPSSFRGGESGSDSRQESRRRHWWPESLGGAPLGAITPKHPLQQGEEEYSGSADPDGWEMVEHALDPREGSSAASARGNPSSTSRDHAASPIRRGESSRAGDGSGSVGSNDEDGVNEREGEDEGDYSADEVSSVSSRRKRRAKKILPKKRRGRRASKSSSDRGGSKERSRKLPSGVPGGFSELVTVPADKPSKGRGGLGGRGRSSSSERGKRGKPSTPTASASEDASDGSTSNKNGHLPGSARLITRNSDNRLLPSSEDSRCGQGADKPVHPDKSIYESSGKGSLSSAAPTAGFSTLSPLGSTISGRFSCGEVGFGSDGEMDDTGGASPNTLKQLESVKAQLTDLLRALAVSFGQVGYCQGLDYVAAHLIKCLGTDSHRGFASDPERVFTVLIGLFREYGLQHLYSEDLEALQLMLGVLDLLIEAHLPRLHQHFREQDVDVAFFAVGWFQTLFLYTSRMPSDTLLWLWDVWVTERSFKVFFRASLAILRLSEERLLELDLEAIMLYLRLFPHEGVLEKEVLVPAALATKVTDSMLREAQRTLDELKKAGTGGIGWSRSTSASAPENSVASSSPPHPLPLPARAPTGPSTVLSPDQRQQPSPPLPLPPLPPPPPPPEAPKERESYGGLENLLFPKIERHTESRSGNRTAQRNAGAVVDDIPPDYESGLDSRVKWYSNGSGMPPRRNSTSSWNTFASAEPLSHQARDGSSPMIFGDHRKDFAFLKQASRVTHVGLGAFASVSNACAISGAGAIDTSSGGGGGMSFASVRDTGTEVSIGRRNSFASTGGIRAHHMSSSSVAPCSGSDVGGGTGGGDEKHTGGNAVAIRRVNPSGCPSLGMLVSSSPRRSSSDSGPDSGSQSSTPLPAMPPRLGMRYDDEDGDFGMPPEMDRLATAGRMDPHGSEVVVAERKKTVKGRLSSDGLIRRDPSGSERKRLGGKDEYALIAAGVE